MRASHLLFRLVLALHIGGRFIFACVQILPNHPYVQRPLQTKNVTRLPEFAWKMFDSKGEIEENLLAAEKERDGGNIPFYDKTQTGGRR